MCKQLKKATKQLYKIAISFSAKHRWMIYALNDQFPTY